MMNDYVKRNIVLILRFIENRILTVPHHFYLNPIMFPMAEQVDIPFDSDAVEVILLSCIRESEWIYMVSM